MRSSKSRQRSKPNRPRPLGNIVNRVFESSGPEGKVRGTPQQIIEKYLILARDAQLANDRVAAEAFLQHAEHYTRLLGEAQREMAREQEGRREAEGFRFGGREEGQVQPREGQQQLLHFAPREGQRDGQGETGAREGAAPEGREARGPAAPQGGGRPREEQRPAREERRPPREEARPPRSEPPAAAVIDLGEGAGEDSGLVETPEQAALPDAPPPAAPVPPAAAAAAAAGPARAAARPRGPVFVTEPRPAPAASAAPAAPPAAAEAGPELSAAEGGEAAAAPAAPRRRRYSRRPKAEAGALAEPRAAE